jgi:hypothetical protein
MPGAPVDPLKMIGSVYLEALTKLIPLRRQWFGGWSQLIGYVESSTHALILVAVSQC